MPARVVYSQMALDDLDGIWAFYAIDCVYIDRVLDGRSDYLRQLFGLPDSGIDFYVQPSS